MPEVFTAGKNNPADKIIPLDFKRDRHKEHPRFIPLENPLNSTYIEAINELGEVANSLKDEGYNMYVRKTPYGKRDAKILECYIKCKVIGFEQRVPVGVFFKISKYPNIKPEDENIYVQRYYRDQNRYKFKYEEALCNCSLGEKWEIINANYPGISKFKYGYYGINGNIEFRLDGIDLKKEALDIINLTHKIIGFEKPNCPSL